jgi:D-3-phosphoglycerate dehydrogenase
MMKTILFMPSIFIGQEEKKEIDGMRKKVLVSAPYMQMNIERFRDFFEEHRLEITLPKVIEKMDESELFRIIGDFDGAVCGDDPFTARVLQKAKKLRVISKWGTGINSIDTTAAKELGIAVCNTPNAFSHPVADTTLAYMLSFARNVLQTDKLMKNGIWRKLPGFSLSEKTLGIIGFGNIGAQVAKRAHAFHMQIIANDIKSVPPILLEQYHVKMVDKDELYENSDFVSLHCDLNECNHHLLCADTFGKMKRKPYVINTARGGLIEYAALITALEEGFVSGAALDVFETEPLPADDRLLKREDVILAPHNSNSSAKYWDIVHRNTLGNLIKWLE